MTNPDRKAVVMQVTNTQRERAIETLSKSFADDAITMEDFESRAEAVYRALTLVDLQKLVADLPHASGIESSNQPPQVDQFSFPEQDSIRNVFSSVERSGSIKVPLKLRLRNVFGNIELHYGRATFAPGVTEVDARCLFGNIEITVPYGVRVELACASIFASVSSSVNNYDSGHAQHDPNQSVLRIVGSAAFANIEVHILGETNKLLQPPRT
ncbi:MAG: DUF1707 domain-containing protein [Gemmatimonadaceae bacterium]